MKDGCTLQDLAAEFEQLRATHLTPAEWHATLGDQLEDLLAEVWRCERMARAEDRLELALKQLPDASREDVE
jgi:hypothetical protein